MFSYDLSMPHSHSLVLPLVTAVFLAILVSSAGAQVKVPGADWGVTDPNEMREKALAAEAKQDWDSAMTYWERVIDRSVSSRAQRLEAYEHIVAFRSKVKPLNTDPAKAKPWPTLVVIFRTLNCSWEDHGQTKHFVSHVGKDDEEDIRHRVSEFARYVFTFTDGLLRIDPEFLIIDEPLVGTARGGSFSCPPSLTMPIVTKHLKDKDKAYEHTMVYVKFVGDDGTRLGPPYIADTGGGGPGGASYMDYPFYPKEYSGQAGEVEFHEFLHPVDMMFNDVVGYPDGIVRNPDEGPGDRIYKRPQGEVGIVSLYEYIFRVRYTRLMWSELTQHEPKEFFWGGPNLCDWMVCGPFTAPEGKDSLDEAFVPEDKLAPREGEEVAGRRWVHARSMHGVIDLETLLGEKNSAVAYLATSQRISGLYALHMGSSGGLKAWVNGKLVHTARGARDFAFNQDKADITVKPGFDWNLYVFKVQNSGRGWKFQARVAGPDQGIPWGSQHALPGAK